MKTQNVFRVPTILQDMHVHGMQMGPAALAKIIDGYIEQECIYEEFENLLHLMTELHLLDVSSPASEQVSQFISR